MCIRLNSGFDILGRPLAATERSMHITPIVNPSECAFLLASPVNLILPFLSTTLFSKYFRPAGAERLPGGRE